jgi:hypothetical protein
VSLTHPGTAIKKLEIHLTAAPPDKQKLQEARKFRKPDSD